VVVDLDSHLYRFGGRIQAQDTTKNPSVNVQKITAEERICAINKSEGVPCKLFPRKAQNGMEHLGDKGVDFMVDSRSEWQVLEHHLSSWLDNYKRSA